MLAILEHLRQNENKNVYFGPSGLVCSVCVCSGGQAFPYGGAGAWSSGGQVPQAAAKPV